MKDLENVLFGHMMHYNHHTELWTAVPRDKISQYFNGELKRKDAHRSKDLDLLLEKVKYVKTSK